MRCVIISDNTMKDYKDTILMPQTDFPMRGNLGQTEPLRQTFWETQNIYQKRLAQNEGNTPFILPDGPPYANGDIHIGHALNKILKDMIIRDKSMRGFYTRYVPGWDTHGLPIESALLKSGNIDRKTMSVSAFREACAAYAHDQIERQRTQFKRLGILGEWDRPYVTLDKHYEASQLEVFAAMVEQGLIFKGLKPVFWSPSSETALAEAEIEYAEKKSPSVYVTFKAHVNDRFKDDVHFLIWTTTPWTLPANLAIAVDTTFDYVLASLNDKRVIFAKDLHATLERVFETALPIVETFKGAELLGITYQHPLYDRSGLVVAGHHVTTESGTGLVHIAPGHGEDDFIIGQANGLDVLCPVDGQGKMTAEALQYEGLFVDDCSKHVTQDLEAQGDLVKLVWVNHAYPHDWRTHKPVIFRATDQWFASIESLKPQMLEAIQTIEWVPKWGQTRMENMVKDRVSWCISRQRTWGVPIPVFYAENQDAILDGEIIRHVAHLFKEHGSNIWFEWEATQLLPQGYSHPGSPNGVFRKETDILDVWFDSGTSHKGGMTDLGMGYPADVYVEGSDQYRGWFNSSLSTGIAYRQKAPYKTCLTHGFVLDGEGHKMSKSKGNVVDPVKVMNEMGADILRLWVASVDYQSDVRISPEVVKQITESYRKIRNTMKFMLGTLSDFNPHEDAVALADLADVDRYMMLKIDRLIETCDKAYDTYAYDNVGRAIVTFVTRDLSAFYLDYAKDPLYIERVNDPLRRGIQTVIHRALDVLTRLLNPILPHTTEEVYQAMPYPEKESIYLENMPQTMAPFEAPLWETFEAFMVLRDKALKALEEARDAKVIGKSLQAALTIHAGREDYALLASIERLEKLFIVSSVDLKEAAQTHIEVATQAGEVCARCWHVGEVNEDGLCVRCQGVLSDL